MIVVDASLAVKWVLLEEYSEQARHLYQFCVQEQQPIVAPSLILSEVSSIIRKRMRRTPFLPRSEALQLLDTFLSYPIDLVDSPEVYHQALILADVYGQPAIYDAVYLALAQVLDYEFWTDDRQLVRRVAGDLSFVRWIGDFTGSARPER